MNCGPISELSTRRTCSIRQARRPPNKALQLIANSSFQSSCGSLLASGGVAPALAVNAVGGN